jgi:hypothetical protein
MTAPSRSLRALAVGCLALAAGCGADTRFGDASVSAAQSAQGGAQVYARVDFDSGENPFAPTDPSRVALAADPNQALSGRSLHIARAREGRYIGASIPLAVQGARDLRIAFAVRARAMQKVAVNVFDRRRQDNTTPASPARIFDDDWHTVVFAAEDFHYNSNPPDEKIDLTTDFVSLLFHGTEDGPAAELWVDKLVVYRGRDDRPPAAPTAVRAVSTADGTVDVTWQEPADNTFAVVYSVHRRTGGGTWEKVGESLRPRFRDRPTALGAHTYRITAADFENNLSPPSSDAPVGTTVPAPGGNTPPAPPPHAADRLNYAEHVRLIHARGAGTVRPDVFLFAGDSLTAATVYTHILGSWLARGLTVRQGVGTVTSDFGAANIDAYLADTRPEFAVVMYGTNDLDRVPESQSMRNLAAVIDACVQGGTIPIVATIPPRGFDKREQQGPERFNRALVGLARQKRVPVSDVFEEMMRHDLKAMLYDGIHLQPEAGNDAAGRALRQTMDQVYFALRDASGSW